MTGFRGQPVTVPGKAQKKNQGPNKRLVVPFEENRHMPHLLGEHDVNLAILEDRLGITAVAHGNVITINGPDNSCDIAREVLEKLYARVVTGETLNAGDFDGLIRHARKETSHHKQSSGQAQIATRRKVIKARTPAQSDYIRAFSNSDLVFGLGPAGTGKTYLAVAFAAQCLESGLVERLILSRPAVEAGERLGFLPGDMRDKVDPYLRPLYDALYDVLPPEKVERDLENGIIEIAPLAFMRGRTLANSFIILDEAQNTSSMQMKMFLTRLGENAKMAVTGDPSQIDLPSGTRSGLEEAVSLLSEVRGIEHVRFSSRDVVRRELVGRIVKAYDDAKKA